MWVKKKKGNKDVAFPTNISIRSLLRLKFSNSAIQPTAFKQFLQKKKNKKKFNYLSWRILLK